jgi:hypothetical protein
MAMTELQKAIDEVLVKLDDKDVDLVKGILIELVRKEQNRQYRAEIERKYAARQVA